MAWIFNHLFGFILIPIMLQISDNEDAKEEAVTPSRPDVSIAFASAWNCSLTKVFF